ncbi:MAG: hypothetical protein LUH07_11390 [Lachnospiraceae bacterium]|nr:hypothetical protein [Lachnospiraceae bacterium]
MKRTGKKFQAIICALALLSTGAVSVCAEEAETETEASEVVVDYREIDVNELVAEGADIVHNIVYGVYSMEGEGVDSSIQTDVYYDLGSEEVVYIDFEEVLMPYSTGGAEGWGFLDEDTAAALGDAVVTVDGVSYPMYFQIAGLSWTGAEEDSAVVYTAEVDGSEVEFINYIAGADGGAWYHENREEGALLLDAEGNEIATVEIETKASINHGVDFWSSEITFPGNIQLIKNYIYDYGVNYEYAPDGEDIYMNDDGEWVVVDVVTSATLAGAPNYFNFIKEAYENILAGDYIVVEAFE